MTIGFNKYQFYGKIIILTIVLFFIGLFAYYRPPVKFNNAPIGGIIFMIAVWTLFMFVFILMILQLIFLPKGVDIDLQNKELTLKFLLAKPLIILSDDVKEFCTIAVNTKSSTYEGLLVRMKNGKEYILAEFNLEDFKPVKAFLEETNVAFAGHYKFSFVSYFFKYFTH